MQNGAGMPKPSRFKDPEYYAVLLRDAFASGNGSVAIIGLLAGFIIYKLKNPELVGLLKEFIHSPMFATLGWVLLFVSIFVARRLFEWKDNMHKAEMTRIANEKSQAQQQHFKQPLLGSEFEQKQLPPP